MHHCAHCFWEVLKYLGIGTDQRLTFEMWQCTRCGARWIGKKTFQPIIPDYSAYSIPGAFAEQMRNPGEHIRLDIFPDDA